MSAADSILASLKSIESKDALGFAAATSLCIAEIATEGAQFANNAESRIVYDFGMVQSTCSHISEISSPPPKPVTYVPKTPLGATLMTLRKKAIERGMPLLTEEQIIEEISRRRGDLPNGEV